jgi:hypothetical protein
MGGQGEGLSGGWHRDAIREFQQVLLSRLNTNVMRSLASQEVSCLGNTLQLLISRDLPTAAPSPPTPHLLEACKHEQPCHQQPAQQHCSTLGDAQACMAWGVALQQA